MKHVLTSLAALAFWAFGVGAVAAPAESAGPAGKERMQHWAADHAAMLDAKLAGLKAGLKLTSDQEKLWAPFEAAVRDAAKLHMDQMKAMMGRMQDSNEMQEMGPPGEANSPVDRLEALAKHISERGAAMLSVAKAAKPLYASLDDSQKRLFRLLDGETLMVGHGHHGMGMMGGMGEGMMGGTEMMGQGGMGMEMMGGGRGMMGEGGKGMRGRELGGMKGDSWNDDEETDQE